MEKVYLTDRIQRSVSSFVLDVYVMDIVVNHVKEVSHRGEKLHHVLLYRNDDRQVEVK